MSSNSGMARVLTNYAAWCCGAFHGYLNLVCSVRTSRLLIRYKDSGTIVSSCTIYCHPIRHLYTSAIRKPARLARVPGKSSSWQSHPESLALCASLPTAIGSVDAMCGECLVRINSPARI